MNEKQQKEIFAKNLNYYINKYEKTQLEIAEKIGVSPQTFNTWCRGIAIPRMGKVQSLADYFHIEKSDLIDEKMPEREFNKIFSERLRYYLNRYEITQLELSKRLGVGTTSVYNWCNGIKTPRMDKVDAMCQIFNCKRSDLMEDRTAAPSKNATTINVLGRVAAGIPIEAVEDIIDTEEITEELARTGEFFGLQIHGDSMEPRMCEGDVVIVRKQDDAESGDIVIALINGDDATCKRLMKYAGGIGLISLNLKYEPMMFSSQEIIDKPVRIIGKVIELRGKF